MPVDPHLTFRDAGTSDTEYIIEVLSRAAASAPIAAWLLPSADARTRHVDQRIRALVRDRIAATRVRVAVDDARILGACVWTSCAGTDHASPCPDDLLLRHEGDAHRTRLLQQQLTAQHARPPHQHLLLVGVAPELQRHGIGCALFTDWHDLPTHTPAGRYSLVPDTLAGTATSLGYRALGIPITTSLTVPLLYPMWHPDPRLGRLLESGNPVPGQPHRAGAAPW